MKPEPKDILVPKEILGIFKNSVRIIDKRITAGMWPVEARQFARLRKIVPELFSEANIMNRYNFAVTYTGKKIQNDLVRNGFEFEEKRIIKNIFIYGIPVPWQMLKKAGIDHKKINVILTPKM